MRPDLSVLQRFHSDGIQEQMHVYQLNPFTSLRTAVKVVDTLIY